MSMLTFRLAAGVGAVIAIIAALLILTGALTARGGNSDIELPGIPEEQIDLLGIKLLKPEGAPAITAEQAAGAALDHQRGGEVQSTTLARLVNDNAVPRLDALAWAVSLDPASVRGTNDLGGPNRPNTPHASPTPRHCGLRLSYDVIFIDATTGAFIFEAQRSGDYQTLAPGATCPPTPVWTLPPATPSPSP